MMHINSTPEADAVFPPRLSAGLPGIAEAVLGDFDHLEAEAGVLLVDNRQMREYNRDYRGIDEPTDVLAFALLEKAFSEPDVREPGGQPELLGDIVISVEKASEQAMEHGHSVEQEVCILMIHGLLHLLGFDHRTEEENADMREKEAEIYRKYVGEYPR
ncbi:MAG: rRNA maturation RNase YbeY [Bacillota bacterium]